MLSPELREKAQSLVDRYPVGRSALLPLLHLVQSQDGYISDDGVAECASLLKLTKAEVNAVATFYTMYKRHPLGRHLVSVCTNFACQVRGSAEVYTAIRERLGVGHDETTEDGAITLEHAECLGNCDGAPVVSVDYFNYECLSPEAALELVDSVIAGNVPPPTRGYSSPGIRAVQHRLAGLGPAADDLPGVAPDQATSTDAAPAAEESGPGSPGATGFGDPADTQTAEFAGTEGGGAEEEGPERLEPESGSGSDERDAESAGDPRLHDQEGPSGSGSDATDQDRQPDAGQPGPEGNRDA